MGYVSPPEPGRDGVADQWHQGYHLCDQWFWSEVDHDHHDFH